MKFKDWLDYPIDKEDIIYGCSDPAGHDRNNYQIPLGCADNYKYFAHKHNTSILTNHPLLNTKLLFYNFSITDTRRKFFINSLNMNRQTKTRQTFKRNLDIKYKMHGYPSEEYFKNIGKYKFVISPEGNGTDCFRHYEAWISKGIPIIEKNLFIAQKYRSLPILWTEDYSEINDDYLSKMYNIFLEKTFDFRRLLLKQYNPKLQYQMKHLMNLKRPEPTSFRGKQTFWTYEQYFPNLLKS